jgi:hypothetical protein
VCIHPILAFVRRGWEIKRVHVLSGLSENAKRLYLKVFLKADSQDPSADFDEMRFFRYGRYRLIPSP